MPILKYLIVIVAGYFLGSLSSSVFLSKFSFGRDVRKSGSGNAGATNMARVFGLGAGFLTLGCDMLKTALALYLGYRLLGDWGILAGGAACMTGHCFPLYHEFKGGKGISAGAIIGLFIDWRVFVGIVAVFLIVAFSTKKVSAGSIAAAFSIVVFCYFFGVSAPKLILACYAGALAIFQHRSNIKRLIEGTEPDFKAAAVAKDKAKHLIRRKK